MPSSGFPTRSIPQYLHIPTQLPPPASPSAPVSSSRYSTLSKTRYLRVSTRSSRSTLTTSIRSTLPPRPSAPVPSSQYSSLSKPQHIHASQRLSRPTSAACSSSSPAPSAHPVPSVNTRAPSGTSTWSDSFPSTRCFISAALKAAATCSSPAPKAPSVSTFTSTPSSSILSTRSRSLLSIPPIPAARFNRAGNRLGAALKIARRRRRERVRPCSSSSPGSWATISSRQGSKGGSAQAHACGRRNIKSAKSVRFGGETVHEIDRWIKPGVHSQREPPSVMGRLTGWSVTPLDKPEVDEDRKYTTYWGGQVSQLTHTHLPGKPCGRSFCSWNALANVQSDLYKVARLNPNNPYLSIRPGLVFEEFNRMREKLRVRGHYLL
ncbi:hypothetical protein AJ78_02155 [Emergomyces pasteurianus Ep9510]|uniref:Uncharacterized protein n=1 Tax=Emergomyces pasteurianus Ep9510 TaxID=1447872 RepID=A0A1J9PPC9_9EURO|nr:hypothetical protein AJ78_02155 [Emergomyces pasteurianus Ep9510]